LIVRKIHFHRYEKDFTDREGHGEHGFMATSDQFQSSRWR
jgi:hypothetical protein